MNVPQCHISNFYTHIEIHPSVILGIMGNLTIFCQHNQLPRNNFGASQARQAASIYHTNYLSRFDKSAIVLNHGQLPLVRSRYLEYINHERIPYGNNCIIAIMSSAGYNVEDSLYFNESSIKRGLFSTTYYTSYSDHETTTETQNTTETSYFMDIGKQKLILDVENVNTTKYDYSKLNESGLIRKHQKVNDKTILIGKVGVKEKPSSMEPIAEN